MRSTISTKLSSLIATTQRHILTVVWLSTNQEALKVLVRIGKKPKNWGMVRQEGCCSSIASDCTTIDIVVLVGFIEKLYGFVSKKNISVLRTLKTMVEKQTTKFSPLCGRKNGAEHQNMCSDCSITDT
jgi:hypothetical protein